jgi:hypothetical protein
MSSVKYSHSAREDALALLRRRAEDRAEDHAKDRADEVLVAQLPIASREAEMTGSSAGSVLIQNTRCHLKDKELRGKRLPR